MNNFQQELKRLGIDEKDLDFNAPYMAQITTAREKDELQRCRQEDFDRICPDEYRKTNLLHLTTKHPKVHEVLTFSYSGRGLTVNGVTGHGKTRSLWMLIKRLYVDSGVNFEWFDSLTFADAAVAAAKESCLANHIKRLRNHPVVVLDDLGKAKITQKVGEALFQMIEARTSRGKPTYITTNFVGDTLASRFEDQETALPLIRRIREFSHTITL